MPVYIWSGGGLLFDTLVKVRYLIVERIGFFIHIQFTEPISLLPLILVHD